MIERIDTVVVGGGQAGLAMSYYLKRQGREHVVSNAVGWAKASGASGGNPVPLKICQSSAKMK
jgi:glycine/D-amino acid oxidase-like deaminating enzyme